jgi:hypothetical protein
VGPSQPEVCNWKDDNCNLQVDEGDVCAGQAHIYGTVFNAKTKTPVTVAMVEVLPAGKCALTGDLAPPQETTVTVDAGDYAVLLGKGSYCLEITAPGYKKAIVLDFALPAGGFARIDVPMEGLFDPAVVNVCGKVTDAGTGKAIQGAAVNLSAKTNVNIVASTATDLYGNYCIGGVRLSTSNQWWVGALMTGYVPQQKGPLTLAGQTTVWVDFALAAVPETVCWKDGFEAAGTGWTASAASLGNTWQRLPNGNVLDKFIGQCVLLPPDENCTPKPNDPPDNCPICSTPTQTGCLPQKGALPRAYEGRWAAWFGQTATGSFIGDGGVCVKQSTGVTQSMSTAKTAGTWTSAQASIPNGVSGLKLRFAYWYEIESVDPAVAQYDLMRVQVLEGTNVVADQYLNPLVDANGAASQCYSSGGFFVAARWTVKELALAGNQAGKKLTVCFTFDTKNTNYNDFRGWSIDDVKLLGVGCK